MNDTPKGRKRCFIMFIMKTEINFAFICVLVNNTKKEVCKIKNEQTFYRLRQDKKRIFY